MILPQFVIDYCQKHPACKGCKLACAAPTDPVKRDLWIKDMIEKIREKLNK